MSSTAKSLISLRNVAGSSGDVVETADFLVLNYANQELLVGVSDFPYFTPGLSCAEAGFVAAAGFSSMGSNIVQTLLIGDGWFRIPEWHLMLLDW
jgi:hypothetical protein